MSFWAAVRAAVCQARWAFFTPTCPGPSHGSAAVAQPALGCAPACRAGAQKPRVLSPPPGASGSVRPCVAPGPREPLGSVAPDQQATLVVFSSQLYRDTLDGHHCVCLTRASCTTVTTEGGLSAPPSPHAVAFRWWEHFTSTFLAALKDLTWPSRSQPLCCAQVPELSHLLGRSLCPLTYVSPFPHPGPWHHLLL